MFYELLLITEEDGSLAVKLKHFDPDLRGWEEREVYLAIEDHKGCGAAREETFECSRAKP